MNEDNIYRDEKLTSEVVNQVYADLCQDRTYSQDWAILYGLGTDCELVDGIGSTATANTERGYFNYNTNTQWSKSADMWKYMFAVIEDADLVINGINKSPIKDNAMMKAYFGEVKCIRAMVYLDLIRAYGDVPLKLEPTDANLTNAYLSKTDRDVILDTLINDLEVSIDGMPWAGENGFTTEHATKSYAHALIAQLALTRAGYAIREAAKPGYETAEYSDPTYPTQRPDAATRKKYYEIALNHLSAIINSGKHKLNPSFHDEWYLLNQLKLDKTYQENLFEIALQANVTSELGYTAGYRLADQTSDYGFTNSSGKLKLTASLFYSYDKNDERRDITCATSQIKKGARQHINYDGNGNPTDTVKVADAAVETMLGNTPFGLYCGKWDPRMENEEWLKQNKAASAKHLTGINVVKVRYAQVLLWYAEIMNELAGPDGSYNGDAGLTARQALALVHERAFSGDALASAKQYVSNIPADKDKFFDALVQENAWELAGEGARKWDLIRWNLLAQKIYEMKQDYLNNIVGNVPETVYYNYVKDTYYPNTKIDMSSITWYGLPAGKTDKDYDGSIDGFGKAKDGTISTDLPSICGGLVGTDPSVLGQGVVKNRYLIPIQDLTINASNNSLKNSYGY